MNRTSSHFLNDMKTSIERIEEYTREMELEDLISMSMRFDEQEI